MRRQLPNDDLGEASLQARRGERATERFDGADAAVRAVVVSLQDDRPTSPDIEALDGLIAQGTFDRMLP